MADLRDTPLRALVEVAGEYVKSRRAGAAASASGEAAWAELGRRVGLLATRFAFPLEAEEVAQRVLFGLQSSERLSALGEARNPTAYLIQVVRNEVRELARKQEREHRLRQELQLPSDPGSEDPERTDAEPSPWLRAAIERLPRADRELLRLRFWRGLSISEIASGLGISYSAVAVRMFRALKRLRADVPTGGE